MPEIPIDPEYGRFVQGMPDDALAEIPPEGGEGMEVELELTDEDPEELPDGSVRVRMEVTGPMANNGSHDSHIAPAGISRSTGSAL
jgi:hypothetical protein